MDIWVSPFSHESLVTRCFRRSEGRFILITACENRLVDSAISYHLTRQTHSTWTLSLSSKHASVHHTAQSPQCYDIMKCWYDDWNRKSNICDNNRLEYDKMEDEVHFKQSNIIYGHKDIRWSQFHCRICIFLTDKIYFIIIQHSFVIAKTCDFRVNIIRICCIHVTAWRDGGEVTQQSRSQFPHW